jgi:ABC-type antimicrobial peptide transport system permease subunit
MLKNYFKTAWRNLSNNKGYSAINILGLASGMAVALLIGLWVYHEHSYDKFLPGHNRLYRVQRNFNSNGEILTFSSSSLKLADALRNQVPEIEYVAESDWMVRHGLMVGDKKIYINGAQIGGDFLKMFQYPLIKGNANDVLKDPYSIVLTQSTAKTLFGDEDPIGKTVRFENKNDLKVTGILKDVPSNSSLQFNFLVPFTYYEQNSEKVKADRIGSYGDNAYQQFVKLKDGISYNQVAPKIKGIQKTETNSRNAMLSDVILHPLAKWHLYSEFKNGKPVGGFIEYVRMFSIIGILVLLIACINFINLTTARSEKRAKEVGIRKTIGSQRKDLIFQFLMESFLLTVIAFLFSILFVQLALPAFNRLTGTKISIPFSNTIFWLLMLACIVITALLAGSRPAFYLSSFQPVKVLKNNIQAGKGVALPRKILVVLQFACSVALIISTIIIYKQVQFAKDRPIGYDINSLLITDINNDLDRNYTALKHELMQQGIVEKVTRASSPATNIYWHSDVDNWPGKNAGETIEMGTIIVAEDYFETLGISLTEGRKFINSNDTTSVIFNEAAIKAMRIENPLGQTITWNGRQYRISGIVKDVLMESPFAPAEPSMFFTSPESQRFLMYRLAQNVKPHEAITKLTSIFNKYNPAYPYEYQFADENYAKKFKLEVLIGKLAGVFAALAIFISCLGLFGLASFVAEKRTKEIGIRKVLGATIYSLWKMLSTEFVVLVMVACCIAVPLAYYFLNSWLQNYEYRTAISWWVFAVAVGGALLITLLTVSFQAIKAAITTPVKSLRTE